MLALAHSLAMLFAARIVDGLSGGNITHGAGIYRRHLHRREPRASRSACSAPRSASGSSSGPALGGLFARISYTAPIWAAAIITSWPRVLAWVWLPETVHRVHAAAGSPWKALRRARAADQDCGCSSTIDFLYWTSFAVYQTTFALFGARRFGFDAAHIGYLLSAFGLLGVRRAGRAGRSDRPRARRDAARSTLGLLFAAVGWGGSALTHSLPIFIAMLVPGAIGIGLCNRVAVVAREPRSREARAGTGAGRRRRTREPRPDARSGVGERRAAVVRRRHRVRLGGARAYCDRRADVAVPAPRPASAAEYPASYSFVPTSSSSRSSRVTRLSS